MNVFFLSEFLLMLQVLTIFTVHWSHDEIISHAISMIIVFILHYGSYLLERNGWYLWFDFLFSGLLSIILLIICYVFQDLYRGDVPRDKKEGEGVFWLGVRIANLVFIPVLVLRSWKFKIGIYIALYIVLLAILNDFRNAGSLWTIVILAMVGWYMASIWKVVDN